MGEAKNAYLRLEFDPKLRLSFHGATVAVPRDLFAAILARIARLREAPA